MSLEEKEPTSHQTHYMQLFPRKKKPRFRDTIAVDFDGTLNSYVTPTKHNKAYEIPDPPVPGALEWIKEVSQHFNVVVFSARASGPGGHDAIVQWLAKWGFPDLPVTSEKPIAKIYLDDRAIQFSGEFPSVDLIKNFKPYNR